MKKITKTIDVFVTENGVEFLTEKQAIEYEKETIEKRRNITCFKVYHSPDLTEGRGYTGLTYIFVECNDGCDDGVVREYCYNTFGPHLAFVQGTSRIMNWAVMRLPEWPDMKNLGFSSVGDIKFPAKVKFLSETTSRVWGLPDAEWYV